MKTLRAVAVAITCVTACMWAGFATGQPASSVLPIYVDYMTPPPSEPADFAALADVVVVVQVRNIRDQITDSRGSTRDVTKYETLVRDTVKAHPMLPPNGESFEITRQGGQHVDDKGRVIRSAVVGFEEFQKDREYLLFLSWNARTNQFDIMYGPDGSYEISPEGSIRALGKSDVARKLQGKPKQMVVEGLRVVR